MVLISSISDSLNYSITQVDHSFKKIVRDPSKLKDLLTLTLATIKGVDLYSTGDMKDREVCKILKGSVDILGFYSTYKFMMYWVNLFSKENMDEKGLKESITNSLNFQLKGDESLENTNRNIEKSLLVKTIFEDVKSKESYHSKGEVKAVIRASLITKGRYTEDQAKVIADRIVIHRKARSPVEMFYMACFAVSSVSASVLKLQKMQVVNLVNIAATIGEQSKVFAFVIHLGSDVVLGPIALAGAIVYAGEGAYFTVLAGREYFNESDPAKKQEAYKAFRKASIGLIVPVVDLGIMVAPMFLVLNPPALLALGFASKGIGLICFLAK